MSDKFHTQDKMLILLLILPSLVASHSLRNQCQTLQDCQELSFCATEPCECFHFSSLGSRCVKLSWAEKIRQNLNLRSSDIGPDTCGQDRKLLGAW